MTAQQTATHLEVIVEEPSMEIFLNRVLPKMLGEAATFRIHSHQGKQDLLRKLGARLRGYKRWLQGDTRIIVLLDRDDEDCRQLKTHMEHLAAQARLVTRTTGGPDWQVATRIAIEELEAWFFGEWAGVRTAYPRLPPDVPSRAPYRNPDDIKGGTWEALERILKASGYYKDGLRKGELADAVGRHLDPDINTSPSFMAFRNVVREAVRSPPS